MKREEILSEAENLINGDRAKEKTKRKHIYLSMPKGGRDLNEDGWRKVIT